MSEHPANQLSLVADIGGTNTRVALADGARLLPDTVRRYSNAEYPGLETVLKTYIKDEGNVDCRAICVAVAGPVRDGVGTMTNLDWQFDRDTLMRASRAEHGVVLNDLQAQGHALGHVAAENIRPIVTGGTDVHLVLVDLRDSEINGQQAEDLLSEADALISQARSGRAGAA